MKGEYLVVRHGGYDFDVIVTIGMALRDVQALVKKLDLNLRPIEHRAIYDDEEESGTLRGRTVHCESGLTVLMLARLPRRGSDAAAYGAFAHEVFHAVAKLFRRLGIRLRGSSTEEAYAYAIQGLVQSILAEYAKPPSKRRKR